MKNIDDIMVEFRQMLSMQQVMIQNLNKDEIQKHMYDDENLVDSFRARYGITSKKTIKKLQKFQKEVFLRLTDRDASVATYNEIVDLLNQQAHRLIRKSLTAERLEEIVLKEENVIENYISSHDNYLDQIEKIGAEMVQRDRLARLKRNQESIESIEARFKKKKIILIVVIVLLLIFVFFNQ